MEKSRSGSSLEGRVHSNSGHLYPQPSPSPLPNTTPTLTSLLASSKAFSVPNSPEPPQYIVRSDGTIRFMKKTSSVSGSHGNPLTKSAPMDGGESRSMRSRLLAPLSIPAPGRLVDLVDESPLLATVTIPEAQSPPRNASSSFDEFASRGKLAPQDPDIQRVAARGVQDIREEEDAARLSVPAASLGQRQSAIALESSLRERMAALHRKSSQMSRFEFGQRAQRIFNEIMYEMIRQVGVQCAERAKVLATIWVRSSDVINALSAMFLDEQERHVAEENKLKVELRQSRKDYLLVVERLEAMVEHEFQSQTELLADSEAREGKLCEQINMLKDEVHAAKAELRRIDIERKLSMHQDERPLPNADEYGLDRVLQRTTSDAEMSPGQEPRSQSQAGLDTSINAAVLAPESPTFDGGEKVSAMQIASLKAELQRQRVMLLDAAEEIRRLKGAVPNSKSIGVTAEPSVEEKGVDPCEELLTESGSDSDDDEVASKTSRKGKANMGKSTRGKRR